ncbi:carboxypeptidase-like regulatory domain-containing protein [candidate division KSB1 bacterium]|nr:carboxypeptidase-like regulatory domain-containing protein [candidate division KSB1 bacterium]
MINFTKNNWRVIFIYFILYPLFFHCNAPRNNPFDPQNPETIFAEITGKVHTLSVPNNPISDVTVYWENDNIFVKTNSNGNFSINNIKPSEGLLLFNKTGFMPETVQVKWDESKLYNVILPLNTFPVIDSLAVYTIVTNRYPEIQTSELALKTKIRDQDNDIDSVYVVNENLNFKKNLLYNINTKLYERTFSILDLNVSSMRKVIGYRFNIFVQDKFFHTIELEGDKAARYIQDEIELISPINFQQVPPSPTLTWNEFTPGFKFKYKIEIYVDEIPAQIVWEKEGIPSDSTNYKIDVSLPENDYFWMIWCIDEFQNRSRSKPASFTVKE